MVKMASDIACWRVHTTMTYLHNMAALLQLRGPVVLVYNIHFIVNINTYQNKVSADQYHMTMGASSFGISFFVNFVLDNCWPSTGFLIGWGAQTRSSYCNQGRIVQNWAGYTDPGLKVNESINFCVAYIKCNPRWAKIFIPRFVMVNRVLVMWFTILEDRPQSTLSYISFQASESLKFCGCNMEHRWRSFFIVHLCCLDFTRWLSYSRLELSNCNQILALLIESQ